MKRTTKRAIARLVLKFTLISSVMFFGLQIYLPISLATSLIIALAWNNTKIQVFSRITCLSIVQSIIAIPGFLRIATANSHKISDRIELFLSSALLFLLLYYYNFSTNKIIEQTTCNNINIANTAVNFMTNFTLLYSFIHSFLYFFCFIILSPLFGMFMIGFIPIFIPISIFKKVTLSVLGYIDYIFSYSLNFEPRKIGITQDNLFNIGLKYLVLNAFSRICGDEFSYTRIITNEQKENHPWILDANTSTILGSLLDYTVNGHYVTSNVRHQWSYRDIIKLLTPLLL